MHDDNLNRLPFQFSQPSQPSVNVPAFPSVYVQGTSDQSTYSSHYAQAYMQPSFLATSSNAYSVSSMSDSVLNSNSHGRMGSYRPQPSNSLQYSSSWYQPGNSRCTFKGCSFTASPKTLEIHMMDRHLIYPEGWERRKKKGDWDADPSLKGKPVPIQGTTLVLDSPEVLEAWIAERKKRWPSAPRVEEKTRKMEEALARGQLSMNDSGFHGRKRRRVDETHTKPQRDRTNHTTGRGRGTDAGWRGRGQGRLTVVTPRKALQPPTSGTESESDSEPEAISSKGPAEQPIVATPTDGDFDANGPEQENIGPAARHITEGTSTTRRPQTQQPKRQPPNPFLSRPTLLRNLLLPEIRITISNLSQAIRFLVDNDFLRGFEGKPGEASETKIEILPETHVQESS